MKTSELIKKLQSHLNRLGDLDIKISIYNHDNGDNDLYDIEDVNYDAYYADIETIDPTNEWFYIQADNEE